MQKKKGPEKNKIKGNKLGFSINGILSNPVFIVLYIILVPIFSVFLYISDGFSSSYYNVNFSDLLSFVSPFIIAVVVSYHISSKLEKNKGRREYIISLMRLIIENINNVHKNLFNSDGKLPGMHGNEIILQIFLETDTYLDLLINLEPGETSIHNIRTAYDKYFNLTTDNPYENFSEPKAREINTTKSTLVSFVHKAISDKYL